MLHVINGDSAAGCLRAAGLRGRVIAWRDVLHEGPVPAPATLDSLRPLRARFLASQGWGNAVEIASEFEQRDRELGASHSEDEVVLWFEHDLYDQLQLAQILDWFAVGLYGPPRLTLVQASDYLGCMPADRFSSMFEARREVTTAQLDTAQRVWRAFSSPDPRAIEDVLPSLDALPFMRAALIRHLEEFPSTDNGLSRTERQAMEALAGGALPLARLFHAAHHEREDPIFLGDAVFFMILGALTNGDPSLVRIDGERAQITDAGRDVLQGRADRVALLGIDRWLGGVHLKGRKAPWRWDAAGQRLVGASPR